MQKPAFKERDVNRRHETKVNKIPAISAFKSLIPLLSITQICRLSTSCTLSQ